MTERKCQKESGSKWKKMEEKDKENGRKKNKAKVFCFYFNLHDHRKREMSERASRKMSIFILGIFHIWKLILFIFYL